MAVMAFSDEFAAMVRVLLAQLDSPKASIRGASRHRLHARWRTTSACTSRASRAVYVTAEASSTVDKVAARLSDQLRDHVIDITRRPVPECLAGHPPQATLIDGRATWICPPVGATVRPITPDT